MVKALWEKILNILPLLLSLMIFSRDFSKTYGRGSSVKNGLGRSVLTTKDLTFFCRIAPTVFDDAAKGVSCPLLRILPRKNEPSLTLQESEERYRQLVEISPDAVIIHQEGKISYINPAAVKLLGASQPDEIIGKNVLDFIHPDFHDSVMKNIEKDLKDEDLTFVSITNDSL